jgi:photosystem II stability/assembly factor-like uncharacterized protein
MSLIFPGENTGLPEGKKRVRDMTKSSVKMSVFLIAAALFLTTPGTVTAASPPGADLVDMVWSKSQGVAVLSKYELFRSTDGKDWLPAGFADRAVELTAVGLGKELIIVATKPGALYRSIGGGAYQKIKAPRDPFGRTVEGIRTIAIHSKDEEILASSGQGLIRSRDKGATWEAIADPFWSNPEARQVMMIGYVNNDPVVVTRNGTYRENKKGFELITKGLPEKVRPTVASVFDGKILMALSGEGIYVATKDSKWSKLKGAPGDPIAFLGFTEGGYLAARVATAMHLGDTKGKTWKPVGQYSPNFIPRKSVSTPFGDFILLRGKGLVRLESDKFLPVQLPADLSSVNARVLTQGNQIVGTQGGVYLSSNAGQVWRDVTPGELGAAINVLLPLSDGRILAGSNGAGVWVSDDNGLNWRNWSLRLGTSNTIKGLVQYNGGILAGTENGLMWTKAGQDPNWGRMDGGVGRKSVIALTQDGDFFWLATQDGVYRARDGQDFSAVPGLAGRVNSLSAEAGKVAALVNGQVVLTDKKLKFTKLPALEKSIASAVGLAGGTVYAGTNDGLYRYDGSKWIKTGQSRHPVAGIIGSTDGIRIITRGAGTRYQK